jgi:hypothetical protein
VGVVRACASEDSRGWPAAHVMSCPKCVAVHATMEEAAEAAERVLASDPAFAVEAAE